MELKDDFSKFLKNPLFKVVTEEAKSLGIKAYLIGGFVRDHLLGRRNKNSADIMAIPASDNPFKKEKLSRTVLNIQAIAVRKNTIKEEWEK